MSQPNTQHLPPIGRGVGAVVDRAVAGRLDQIDRGWLMSLYRSTGAVFLRGFGATLEDFEALTGALMTDLQTNRGAAFSVGPFKRAFVKSDKTVMTATGQRQDFPLPLHGELYYFKRPPRMICFYCERPAAEGGETTIGDGAEIMAAFPAPTADLLRRRRICYQRHLDASEWPTAFQTDSRGEVEAVCRDNEFSVEWGGDGSLVTSYRCPAFVVGADGREIFINDLLPVALGEEVIRSGRIAAIAPEMQGKPPSLVVRWEDGSPIEPEVIQSILKVSSKLEIPVPAAEGDMLLVDNTRVMHGRRGSTDPNRRVLVRMGSPAN